MEGLYTVDAAKADDHLKRMELHHTIERSREIITNYLESMAHYHEKIEEAQHHLGRLDERLNQ